ncbi:hypothetical protein McanMca71_000469 [Microsporum canis]
MARGVPVPPGKIVQLHERNVQLSKDIDDLFTELLAEALLIQMEGQGPTSPTTSTGYSDPRGRLQDLRRIIKHFGKKSVAWRVRILKKRTLLKHRKETPGLDEDGQETTDDEVEFDDEGISAADQIMIKQARHELTHGGDIVDDVEAIQYAEQLDMEQVPEFKSDFANAYGLSFDLAMHIVEISPIELLNTFNIFASVREYPRWQKSEARADKIAIEDTATLIIDAALLVPEADRAKLFGPDGALEEKYRSIQELYLHRVLGIRR